MSDSMYKKKDIDDIKFGGVINMGDRMNVMNESKRQDKLKEYERLKSIKEIENWATDIASMPPIEDIMGENKTYHMKLAIMMEIFLMGLLNFAVVMGTFVSFKINMDMLVREQWLQILGVIIVTGIVNYLCYKELKN